MLTALLGEYRFNKLMSKLNRGGKDLDMLTLADMDGVEMRSAFKRAVVDGKNINVGGKDIVFGTTDAESKFSLATDQNSQCMSEYDDIVVTEELNMPDDV